MISGVCLPSHAVDSGFPFDWVSVPAWQHFDHSSLEWVLAWRAQGERIWLQPLLDLLIVLISLICGQKAKRPFLDQDRVIALLHHWHAAFCDANI